MINNAAHSPRFIPCRFSDIGFVMSWDKASKALKPLSAKSHLASTPPHITASQILSLIKLRAVSIALILEEHAVDIVNTGPPNSVKDCMYEAGVPNSNICMENFSDILPLDNFSEMCFWASCTAVLLAPITIPILCDLYSVRNFFVSAEIWCKAASIKSQKRMLCEVDIFETMPNGTLELPTKTSLLNMPSREPFLAFCEISAKDVPKAHTNPRSLKITFMHKTYLQTVKNPSIFVDGIIYEQSVFASMNNKIGLDKFVIWRETDNEKLPDVSFIPAMTRRRMTDLQKIAVGLATKVVPEHSDYRVVFASRFGEWRQTIKLIEQFHQYGEMSPAGFSNSVHNAAAGAFSLLQKNQNEYTSIAAGLRTLESGILAALTMKKPVLFVYAEEHSPEFYDEFLDAPVLAHGLAFMLDGKGDREIIFDISDTDCSPLTFDKMAEFLEKGGEITTSVWKWSDK